SEELLVLVQADLTAIVDRRDAQARALLRAELLPRDDVRVVLEPGDDDLVALRDVAAPPALRDEVDPLGRAADEDDLLRRRGVDEPANALARGLERVGRLRRERVRGAVDVRVFVLVEEGEAIDDRLRLLRRRRVVEPHEALSAHRLAEDRELLLEE